MKKLTIFETGIIGLLVGVVVAAYLTFIIGNNGFVGEIIGWISLKPLLEKLQVPDNQILLIGFVFFVLVYTLYGLIVGLIIKNFNKSKLLLIPAALLIAGIVFEQQYGNAHMVVTATPDYFETAAALEALRPLRTPKAAEPTQPQQYFGNEATGDLNADGKDDVTFLIHRDDPDRGTLYYVAAALGTDVGKAGTNLVFLGDKVHPLTISIASSTIMIDYTQGTSSTTEKFYAAVKDGVLEKAI